MKYFAAAALILSASSALAVEAVVTDHYKTVIERQPYTVEVCSKKSGVQGGIEGALLGGLLGGAIGGKDTAKGLGLFGAIVGANEAKHNTVCKNETRYNEVERSVYSHSTIKFDHDGRTYNHRFIKG